MYSYQILIIFGSTDQVLNALFQRQINASGVILCVDIREKHVIHLYLIFFFSF